MFPMGQAMRGDQASINAIAARCRPFASIVSGSAINCSAASRRSVESRMSGSRIFLVLLSILLLGYAFLDKAFAYVGVPPFYVGEIVLGLGILISFGNGFSFAVFRSPITWALLAFALWGAVIAATGKDISLSGTLRNSVIWGYSSFALLSAGAILRVRALEDGLDWYGKWMPWFLIWAPVGFALVHFYGLPLPHIATPEEDFNPLKAGDFGVHLAGATAFLALGLYDRFPINGSRLWGFKELILWSCLSAGLVVIGTQNRAGLLAIIAAVLTVMIFKPGLRFIKFLIIIFLAIVLSALLGIELDLGHRVLSAEQLFDNVQSLFGSGNAQLRGTVAWRLLWWETILDYTIYGEHFWTGKGYEINLASSDGFVRRTGNQSPHSVHFSILARSGVPGLALWFLLLVTLFVSLLRRYFRARSAGLMLLAATNLWVMAYLLAAVINMSFDVYLEGPQGGIWFWCLLGYAIALSLAQDELFHGRAKTPSAPRAADHQPGQKLTF